VISRILIFVFLRYLTIMFQLNIISNGEIVQIAELKGLVSSSITSNFLFGWCPCIAAITLIILRGFRGLPQSGHEIQWQSLKYGHDHLFQHSFQLILGVMEPLDTLRVFSCC
jgi:hypothetical protein